MQINLFEFILSHSFILERSIHLSKGFDRAVINHIDVIGVALFKFNQLNTPILLVSHPQVLNFTWTQNQTLASFPRILIHSIITYLSLTSILYHTSTSTSPSSSPLIGPHILRPITAIHNIFHFDAELSFHGIWFPCVLGLVLQYCV